MSTLFGLSVSPWSEKTRWALDYANAHYQYQEFTPMISNLGVRIKSKRFFNRISVPLLIDGDSVFSDSFSIAKHANTHSKKDSLFPQEKCDEIDHWNSISEQTLEAGRALVVINMQSNREACLKSLPPFFPEPIKPLMLPVAKSGLFYLKKKYDVSEKNVRRYEQIIEDNLQKLQKALADNPQYLLGSFTYADICMAVTLQVIKPIQNRHVMLDSATEQCWKNEALAEKFSDLIAWRDDIYQQYRR
ncbi:hypothetical protein A9Q81_21275 [Gammaproteobacteria bacterium 42_54_T18]|mgnify:CR=1 FL=1|nr:hypothetical protein A9Q81_21275 [Gammaproteobacteria bacterium 42_54_T18]